jgi:2-phospho-L-lactate transferase/gluconeogenesis factor (CofD/UPF0052 family)
MANLSTKIKLYANREIDFRTDVLLQDDGNGAYIKEWNLDIPKPTLEQLEQYNVQADLYVAMETLRAKRNKALVNSDWTILGDVPLNPAMRSAWMNYRTLLRNITDNLTNVEDVKAVTLPIPPK